jgi:hypothetical protein
MSTSTGVTGTHAASSGGPTVWRVNRAAVTLTNLNDNNFHVASTDPVNSPLPIELVSFSAQLRNNVVELKWITASETNNDFFTIERGINVERFEPIHRQNGHGNSKTLMTYQAIDYVPLYGRSYYRLRQTDFDGKFTYSAVKVVNYEGPAHAVLTAYPNPLNTSVLTIKIEGLKAADRVPVEILNIRGQKVFKKTVLVNAPGVVTEKISNLSLPRGVYFIKAGNTKFLTQKIVVE